MFSRAADRKKPQQNRFRIRLVIVLVAVVCGVGYYASPIFWRPVGSGAAGPSVASEPFTSVWTERPVLLVGIGDSITTGFGAPPGYGYFDRLIANPSDEFPEMAGICLGSVFPNLRTQNIAENGTNSIWHLEKQIPSIAIQEQDTLGLVVMTTGGIDLIHMYGRIPPKEGAMYGASLQEARPWIGNFGRRLDEMVTTLESRFPGGCHIFLANIYDPSDGVGKPQFGGLPAWPDMIEVLAAYNLEIEKCAQHHKSVHLVDIHGAFLGHGVHCTQFWREHFRFGDPHFWYYENIEDPNIRGYDAIRRLFLLEIIKLSDAFDDPRSAAHSQNPRQRAAWKNKFRSLSLKLPVPETPTETPKITRETVLPANAAGRAGWSCHWR